MENHLQPLVSVLCLSMNHENFIEKSCLSLIDQTFKNFEIIYVDNNSTDRTFEIANKIFLNSGLPYTGYKREKSYGVSANLNFMIKKAKGKYIAILSGDDFWELDNLKEKIIFFEKNQHYGMIYSSGYKYFHDTGATTEIPSKGFKDGWVFKELLKDNFVNGIGVVMKKAVLEEVGLYDERSLVEDWDLWIRIAEKYQIGYLNKRLIYYGKISSESLSKNNDYLDRGRDYIFNKYAQHEEIGIAKKKFRLLRIYQIADENPSFKNLILLLKNSEFSFAYLKQVAKCVVRIVINKKYISHLSP